MKSFLSRFGALILSVLSGFDRLRFRGCSRLLSNPRGVDSYLYQRNVLLKQYREHTEQLTKDLIGGTEALAAAAGQRIYYLNSPNTDKEAAALALAHERGLSTGRIAILSCVEGCRTFRIRKNDRGHIYLAAEPARCQHFYHYFQHDQLGLCYVRLQTWFPFTLRIGINGRQWLYRQLQREGIPFRRQDNLLRAVADWPRAQQLLDDQCHTDWPTLLDSLAVQTNPLLPYLRDDARVPYYWVTEQSEWATDILFRAPDDLADLYPRLNRHCIEVLGCRDVLRFLGRSVPAEGFGRCQAEVKIDYRERREGLRAKLWYDVNSLKVYDKFGCGLRLETTINQATSFKVYRTKEGDNGGPRSWQPLRKGVADLHRQAEVSQRANERLAESLATVADTTPLGQLLEPLGRPVFPNGYRCRALNPLTGADGELLRTVARGDFLLQGFRNRDLRLAL
ncbi:MAG TPA: hypothetical protein VKS79_12375 [Gemmataceae bacterium]|nr:hypothetical protein [Gemmataceae bacterium]